jgi:hypothetical protein
VPQEIIITRREQPALPAGAQPGLLPVAALPERGSQNMFSHNETQPASIHVTIGRIEVRATSAQPSAPKRSAPAPAAMSLDEYLRRRSGGNQ